MMHQMILSAVGIIAGAVSAVCWFWASCAKPVYPLAYLGGPPQDIIDRMNRVAKLNSIAAGAAGVMILCQAGLIAYP